MLAPELEAACRDTPVVLVEGPRRAGKSTLVRGFASAGFRYFTLDDRTTLDAVRYDPQAFLRGIDRAVIDEVQRAPDLLLAIKQAVDDDYRPGRFVLTGSANVMTMPRVADSLAGRIEVITLLPFAQIEIRRHKSPFLDNLRKSEFAQPQDIVAGRELIELVTTGGFPESLRRDAAARRSAWLRNYTRSVLTRDIRDVADLQKMSELPTFVCYAARVSGSLVNYSDLGASIGIMHKTAASYLHVRQDVFLLRMLPA